METNLVSVETNVNSFLRLLQVAGRRALGGTQQRTRSQAEWPRPLGDGRGNCIRPTEVVRRYLACGSVARIHGAKKWILVVGECVASCPISDDAVRFRTILSLAATKTLILSTTLNSASLRSILSAQCLRDPLAIQVQRSFSKQGPPIDPRRTPCSNGSFYYCLLSPPQPPGFTPPAAPSSASGSSIRIKARCTTR